MADEIFHALEGSGHTLEWQVEAEIADRYYARVAEEPRRIDWARGDVFYVAPNTIHQHVAAEHEKVVLLGAQNRIFKLLGYDSVKVLEPSISLPS
jgi:hypothetical protein